MKKLILMAIIFIFSLSFVFSASLGKGTVLNLSLSPEGIERYDIGFSSGQVTETTGSVSSLSQIYLSSSPYDENQAITAVNSTSWVYWRIVSPLKLDLSLSFSETDTEDKIVWNAWMYDQNKNDKKGTLLASTGSNTTDAVFHTKESSTIQDINSKRIIVEASIIKQEDFLNYKAESYNRNLILKVETAQ